jgi:aryl-alcohol dehydrogenase-like predicted oxidoreductase
MKYRRLGRTNLQVSEVGFGAWAIGGPVDVRGKPFGWGPADEAQSTAAIHRALDLGVNFFDTADVYGLGRSEELLGRVLKGRDVVIATKAGNIRSEKGEAGKDFSKDYLFRAVEGSLKRLRSETLDLFQLHNPSAEELRRGDCLEVLQDLREAGKVRYTGISIHQPEEGLAVLTGPLPVDSLQLAYNLLNTRMAERVLPLALEEDVGVIVRVPLQYGLLTGKFERGVTFPKDDHRSWTLSREVIERGVSLLETLAPRLEESGLTAAQFALKFVLSHPAVSVTIPGARTAEQVERNVVASDGAPLASTLLQAFHDAQSTGA